MNDLLIVSFLAVFVCLAGCEKSVEFTQEDRQVILDVSDKVMQASEAGDVSALMSYLDKEILIHIGKEGEDPYSYNYDSYAEYLTQVFPLIDSYSYARKDEKFSYDESDQIKFVFALDEKYMFGGKQINESHIQTWTVLKDGDSFRVIRIDVR